jgi:VWFA-related protein
MVFGRQSIGASVLAMALAGAGSAGGGQQTTAQQNTTQTVQQNVPNAPAPQVPNAPTPQTLPDLNTITPPAPLAPEPPRSGESNPDAADARDNGGVTPTNKLPSSPAAPQTGGQEQAPIIPAPGQGAQEAYTLGVHVDFVQIPFTVKDSKNQFVPDISWRDVRIYENGLRQHIAFWSPDPYPLSVAFVIDQSVTQDTMDKINSSLSALQGAFAPYDEIAVYTYNATVKEQTTFTAAQSNRLGVILERSKSQGREPLMGWGGPLSQTTTKNNQQVDPNTAPVRNQSTMNPSIPKEFHPLYDAMFAAAQSLATVDIKRRRVLYVISDGKEYGSTVKEKELIRYLQTNKISVYATLVGDSSIPGMGFLDRIHLPLTMRDDALPRIATATGGQCDPEFRPRGIENSFADITRTVRTLYTVGYYTHLSPLDGRFRHVEVRVMRPNLTVVAPDGYYPTPRNVHQAQPVAGTDQTPHSDNEPAPAANPPSTQP